MINLRKKDYIWSYVSSILAMGINVAILPFVLFYLDSSSLGLWYVFASINNLIMLLDFGFTPTLARNIAYVWSGAHEIEATGTDVSVRETCIEKNLYAKTLTTSRYIYGVISLIATVILFGIGTVYIRAISPVGDLDYFTIAWIVYAAAILLNLYFNYYSAFLRGIGAVAENAKGTTLAKVVQLVLTPLFLMLGFDILGTSIAYLLSSIVLRIALRLYFYSFKGVKESLGNATIHFSNNDILKLFKTVWHNAWRDGLVSVSMFCCLQANTLICSYILGLSSTGTYGLVIQITSAIVAISNVSYTTVQPKLQEFALQKRAKESSRLFARAVGVYCFTSSIMSVAFILFGPSLVRLLGKDFNMSLGVFVAICVYMIMYRGNNIFISCISNYNEIPYYRAYIVSGILTVISSYLLASLTNIGLWSLVIPPFLILLAYNFWKWPMIVFDKYNISVVSFLKLCFYESFEALSGLFEKKRSIK